VKNQIIFLMGDAIQKQILYDISQCKYFSKLADETTDVRQTEQLSLSVRFIKDTKVHEEFLCFVPVSSTTGKDLASTILTQLSQLKLYLKHMRGRGARNTSGKYRGVQARVKELYPLATYTHCCNHVLNLVISTSSQLPVVRNNYIGHMRFSVAFCTARIDISRQCWKRSFRLGFFAAEAETNFRHALGRKTWLDHHFRDTIASSCFYTWGIAAGKQASGGCDQSSNFAQFCTELYVLVTQHISGIILPVSKLLQTK